MTATQRLKQIVQLLALDATNQAACFPKNVVVADEIALLLDDELRRFPGKGLNDAVGATVASILREIDATFAHMGGKPDRWSFDAMANAPEWQAVRTHARNAMKLLGLPEERPPLEWTTYIAERRK